MKNKVILGIIYVIVVIFLYYFMLPPLNLSSFSFWFYLFIILFLFIVFSEANKLEMRFKKKKLILDNDKYLGYLLTVIGCLILLIFVINFVCSPLFNAKKYSNRIIVDDTHEFKEDVAPVDFSQIPLLDKASSQKLGDRKMGQATDWVSQFYVSDLYTQINYNDSIVRVTPIEYASIIKYFTNMDEGVKGYISVNSVNGEANLVKLDKGMKYLPSAYFFEDLNRKLRFSYPTEIFDEPSFEVDNNGNPYWIIPTVKYTAIGLKKEIDGLIILNAVTGENKKYEINNVPSWVDHVYSADLIIEQLNNWGEYSGGFINSVFGQKNVVNTTEGYNYLVMNDDVYLYTGITSVSSDESNLGFVLVNMRTKETKYYYVPGAEEYSAMASAEGLVQEKKYEASFPLLINLNNKPTYLLSLKDNAGLVKMYAFVDVEDYQKVVVSDASLGIEAAAIKYLGDGTINEDESELIEKTIVIKNVETAVIDGNTNYYFLDSENKMYSASIKVGHNILPFIKRDDKLKIKYYESSINQIVTVNKGE